MNKVIVLVISSFSLIYSVRGQGVNIVPKQKPKNIVVILANGTGMNQIAAASLKKGSPLSFVNFPVTGFTQPWPANGQQPADSTVVLAMGTNKETNKDKNIPSQTLFDFAKLKKMFTGLIVTGSVTEPTAKALVFDNYKKDNEALAQDYVNSNLNIIIGGGSKYFDKRYDGRNLFKDFKTKGYDLIYKQSSLNTAGSAKTVALIEKDGVYRASDRQDFLTKATLFTMRSLININGYFIVVDDTKIGEADTLNNTKLLDEEILDLDKLAAAVAAQMGPETLVLVIGNYECGGLEIADATVAKNSEPNVIWRSKHPTAVLAPVFASGPGAELFAGTYYTGDLFVKIESLMGKGR